MFFWTEIFFLIKKKLTLAQESHVKTRKCLGVREKPNQARETKGRSLRAEPFSLTNRRSGERASGALLGEKEVCVPTAAEGPHSVASVSLYGRGANLMQVYDGCAKLSTPVVFRKERGAQGGTL